MASRKSGDWKGWGSRDRAHKNVGVDDTPAYLSSTAWPEALTKLQERIKALDILVRPYDPVGPLVTTNLSRTDAAASSKDVETSSTPKPRKRKATETATTNQDVDPPEGNILDTLDPFSGIESFWEVIPPQREDLVKQISAEGKIFGLLEDILQDPERTHTQRTVEEAKDKKRGEVDTDVEKQIATKSQNCISGVSLEVYRRKMKSEGLLLQEVSGATTRNREKIIQRQLFQDPAKEIYFDWQGLPVEATYQVLDGKTRIVPFTASECEQVDSSLLVARSRPTLVTSRESMLVLALRLGELQFEDHPLYSHEDVLAVQADELYQEYKTRVAVDLLQYHTQRIEGLTNSAMRLRREYQQCQKKGDAKRSRYYGSKLRRVLEQNLAERTLRDKEELELRQVFERLYKVWRQIGTIRSSVKILSEDTKNANSEERKQPVYIGNPIQLRVRKIQLDKLQEQAKYAKDLEEEVRIRQEVHLLQKSKGKSKLKFSSTEARAIVLARIKKCRKRPGRPLWVPILRKEGLSVMSGALCDDAERQRRNQIAASRVYLVLRVNGRRVTRTESVGLSRKWPRLCVQYDEVVRLRLHSVPKSISVEIMQEGLMGGRKLAECHITPPDLVDGNALNGTYHFVHASKIHGFQPGDFKGPRYLKGNLMAVLQWLGTGRHSMQLEDRTIKGFPRTAVGIRADDLDPNHPDNAAFLERKRRAKDGNDGKDFSVEELPDELLLHGKRSSIVESLRKKVLRSRHDQRLPKNAPPIPLWDRDIPDELCQSIQSRDADGKEDVHSEKAQDIGDPVREIVPSFLQVNFFSFKALSWVLEPRRLRRPVRSTVLPVSNPRACRLVVQIVRGQNLPIKDKAGGREDDNNAVWVEVSFKGSRRRTGISAGTNPTWNEVLTLPVPPPGNSGYSPSELLKITESLDVNVYDRQQWTKVSDGYGTLHTWQEEWLGSLSIPFTTVYLRHPVDGAFPLSVPPQALGYRLTNPNSPTRLWLYVTLDPPLATPPNFGSDLMGSDQAEEWWTSSEFHKYCRSWLKRFRSRSGCSSRHVVVLVPSFSGKPLLCCRYIRPLQPPDGLVEAPAFTRFVSTIPFIEDFWTAKDAKNLNSWCTAEQFLTLGWGDSEEHAILLCNYFKHRENKRSPGNEEKSARVGSWQTFVCSGNSIMRGEVHWVLRISTILPNASDVRRVLLYDPHEGTRYDIRRNSTNIPLQVIGSVFDSTNVWGNIQLTTNPLEMDYDILNQRKWLPLLPGHYSKEKFKAHLTSVQPPVKYYNITRRYFESRAAEVERIIEQRFERWRTDPTTWDYGVAGILRDCLQGLETAEITSNLRGEKARGTSGLDRIKKIYPGIQGFPLRFKDCPDLKHTLDSEENPIIKCIRQTRLHDRRQKNNRFALAVYIHPYPNHIGSCWVYIAALPPERSSKRS